MKIAISAKEIVDKGIKVGEMNAVLLRQIEELWLMMIEVKADNEGRSCDLTPKIKRIDKKLSSL